jgi:ribonuclease HI
MIRLFPTGVTPPPEGWVMVNVDAAAFQKANRMGLGVVITDHRGEFLAACKQGIDKVTNPELAEAISFTRAILFASGLPYNQAIIATDSLSLVHKLQLDGKDPSHT